MPLLMKLKDSSRPLWASEVLEAEVVCNASMLGGMTRYEDDENVSSG